MDVERLGDLRELIGEYWCLAFAEGQEGRNTDTPDGAAQKCISAIEVILREARAALTPPDGYVLVPVDLLRMVIGCAYPASTDINQRGYAWSEAYLDQVLPSVKAALAAARPEVKP